MDNKMIGKWMLRGSKMNENHDEHGRFTSSGGSVGADRSGSGFSTGEGSSSYGSSRAETAMHPKPKAPVEMSSYLHHESTPHADSANVHPGVAHASIANRYKPITTMGNREAGQYHSLLGTDQPIDKNHFESTVAEDLKARGQGAVKVSISHTEPGTHLGKSGTVVHYTVHKSTGSGSKQINDQIITKWILRGEKMNENHDEHGRFSSGGGGGGLSSEAKSHLSTLQTHASTHQIVELPNNKVYMKNAQGERTEIKREHFDELIKGGHIEKVEKTHRSQFGSNQYQAKN